MSTQQNEWSIQKYVVHGHPLGFPRHTFVLREGGGQYAPGFCDQCEDTMVLVGGNWDDGDCAKCGRGACSISWPMDAAQLNEGIAAAMFPRDYEAEDAAAGLPMEFTFTMTREQGEAFLANCRAADVTPQEAIMGGLVVAGLVQK
jgi:hypothetical protein